MDKTLIIISVVIAGVVGYIVYKKYIASKVSIPTQVTTAQPSGQIVSITVT